MYEIFKDVVNSPKFKPRIILGRYVFDPNLLLNCGEIVYCNHPEINNDLQINDLPFMQTEFAVQA